MNRRVNKIDLKESFKKVYESGSYLSNYGSVDIRGYDRDGDILLISLKDEDAHEFIEFMQYLAQQEKHIISSLRESIGMLEFEKEDLSTKGIGRD